jgi:beta-glucosidase
VDDAVRRIVRAMIAAGLLDHGGGRRPGPADGAADLAAARRTATEGIVLLANHDLVPLARSLRHVCVIGGEADAGVPAGGGSSHVTPPGGFARQISRPIDVQPPDFATQVFDPPSPLSRIRSKLGAGTVDFDDGSSPERAAALAKRCDAAIVFAQNFAGEGFDLHGLSLPGGQDVLIAAVAAANPRTVVVLETAGAVTMPWLDRAGAVLETWYPGSAGADAIADILFGDAVPSGRLPVTFPAREADLPNPVLPGAGLPRDVPFSVTYPEGADVGYRWFARRGIRPVFPFGFGLSTTRFAYANLRVTGGRTLTAQFDVRNTGTRTGADVPQLYLTSRGGPAVLRLLGWSRPVLQPGATRHVVVHADMRLLADFDTAGRRWVVPKGDVTVGVGRSAGDLELRATVALDGLVLPP